MKEKFYIESAQMKVISDRISRMTGWLAENAPYCETVQKHLDEGTVERAYWHYGYLCALKDVVSAINRDQLNKLQRGQVHTAPIGRRG